MEEPTSKDQKAASIRTLGGHKPVIPVVIFLAPLTSNFEHNEYKGSLGLAFTVWISTEDQKSSTFYPYAPREISVLTERALGHLR